jgi:hypothetical protein
MKKLPLALSGNKRYKNLDCFASLAMTILPSLRAERSNSVMPVMKICNTYLLTTP